MKSLILITFILFPILERAQTYELVNSTTTEEPKSHHLGFASVDLENEDESDSDCGGYGCENVPGYGAPSPNYGPPTPGYGSPKPEPAGSGADSMLNSVSTCTLLLHSVKWLCKKKVFEVIEDSGAPLARRARPSQVRPL